MSNSEEESARDVVAKVLDCDFELKELEVTHLLFRLMPFEERYENPYFTSYQLSSITAVLLPGCFWRYITHES